MWKRSRSRRACEQAIPGADALTDQRRAAPPPSRPAVVARSARGALPRCVRVLVHAEVPDGAAAARHVYLHDAVALRGDLDGGNA
ncbi:MAG: chorismate mutase [Gemmatimonadaceae bacterium]